MSVFVDTSAFYAILDGDDRVHEASLETLRQLLIEDQEELVTTSYIVLESTSLIQRRLGMTAVKGFIEEYVPLIDVIWVDASLHRRGQQRFLHEGRRKLSMVDCVSFEAMESRALQRVFAFDPHFDEAGFESIPSVR